MTVNEFANRFNLHDSLLEKLVYNKSKNNVELFFDFCYCQQDDYEEDMDETGMILVEFDGVIEFKYAPHEINSDEIVGISHKDNEIILTVFNDISNDSIDIKISANNVTVTNCK